MPHAMGWTHQRKDHRDRSFNAEERIWQAHQLPSAASIWPHVPSIWNQLTIGSCTAHGTLRAFLIEAIKQGLTVPMLSRLMQYWDTRAVEGTTATDAGGTVRDAIKVLAADGCCPESEWPYDVDKFAIKPPAECYAEARQHMSIKYQAVTVGGPGAPIRSALANGLAVAFGFSVPQSFEDGSWDPSTQVLPLPSPGEGFIGGHCVALTGYDFSCTNHPVPYFVADNSWGEGWGGTWDGDGCKGGRFALDYRWFDPWIGLADDLWVIQEVK